MRTLLGHRKPSLLEGRTIRNSGRVGKKFPVHNFFFPVQAVCRIVFFNVVGLFLDGGLLAGFLSLKIFLCRNFFSEIVTPLPPSRDFSWSAPREVFILERCPYGEVPLHNKNSIYRHVHCILSNYQGIP